MRIAIYIRVSTTRQAEEGFSLAAQQKTLEEYCKSHNHSIVNIYADEGISAKDIQHREMFKLMLEDAKSKKFDAILVWKLTRFTRSVKDLINVCDELEAYNVALISYSESFDTSTPNGRLMRNLLGVIAQWEREIISENVRFANREKIEQGNSLATCVLGYDLIDKTFKINSNESKLVQRIFDMYIELQNLSEVAKRLNRAGFTGKNGHEFTAQSILIILTNVFYCGYNRSHNKVFRGNQASIISVKKFNRVQKIVESKAKKTGRRRTTKLIFLP